jgi:hypothetical protein
MNPLENFPAKVKDFMQKKIKWLAESVDLEVFEPNYNYRQHLDKNTQFILDPRPVRDKRNTTITEANLDLTLTLEGLADVVPVDQIRGKRVLEIGPKYGFHSLWIDEHVEPSEFVFCDFVSDRHLHEKWRNKLKSRQTWIYNDIRHADELLKMEPFDFVFFLGVLYHTIWHMSILSRLNAVTRMGGLMLLETTYELLRGSYIRLNWQVNTGKAKAIPSLDALRVMLAWTGWRTVTQFTDYRPGATEILLLCEKTDELLEGSEFAPVVRPPREKISL